MAPIARDAFETHFLTIRDGVRLAFNREGIGGFPMLMLHGWPGGKRLFWRNIAALAAAGFEVIVPDQRGFGESPAMPEHPLSVQESARDVYALMKELGHESCIIVGGDMGSGVAIQAMHLFPGFCRRFVTYNGFAPALPDVYEAAGLPRSQLDEIVKVSDHLDLHAVHADRLADSLTSDQARLDYVASYYTGHVWREGQPIRNLAAAGSFSREDAIFHAEQLADAQSFRMSLGFYESVMNPQPDAEPVLLDRQIEVETLLFWGMHDEIVRIEYPRQWRLGCKKLIGPFFVEAGHFVQWEAAETFNNAIVAFNRDLLAR